MFVILVIMKLVPKAKSQGLDSSFVLGRYPASRTRVRLPNPKSKGELNPTYFSLGKSRMRDLGITTVFDLRSDTEIRKYGTPQPTIEGVEVLWTPVFKTEDYSPEMMAKYVRDPRLLVLSLGPTSHWIVDVSNCTRVERRRLSWSCTRRSLTTHQLLSLQFFAI
jgi:hypothetical protein